MEEPINVRYTFVLLLAIADPDGYVIGTDVAIARRLNMSLKEFKRCVAVLSQPDENSNSKEEEGRRVVGSNADRGYFIVNFATYRDMKNEEERRTYMRDYMRKYREGKQAVNSGKTELAELTHADSDSESPTPSAKAEAGREIPDWPSVKTYAFSIGLPEWRARGYFDELETCGWLDHKSRPILKWKSAFSKCKQWWENDGMPSTPQKNNGRPNKNSSTSSRNAGTRNEGLASQYRDIGRE